MRVYVCIYRGGLGGGEDERFGASLFQQQKKLENWEDQVMNLNSSSFARASAVDVKQEIIPQTNSQIYNSHVEDDNDDELITPNSNSWSHHHHQPIISSPTSCITTLSTNNILNFSGGKSRNQHNQDHSSEVRYSIIYYKGIYFILFFKNRQKGEQDGKER